MKRYWARASVFGGIAVGHWIAQFIAWSYADSYAGRSITSQVLWYVLSTPLVQGTAANEHFWTLAALNSTLWAAFFTWLIFRLRLYALPAVAGACVGVFWLVAITAGVNGARWPPNGRYWLVTCPFIPLVGLNSIANFLVPVLNGVLYLLAARLIVKLTGGQARSSDRQSETNPA